MHKEITTQRHEGYIIQYFSTEVDINSARFENLTTVVIKSSIFWGTKPYISLKVKWRFEGTSHLDLQGKIINQARRQNKADGTLHAPLKLGLTFNELHGFISHKFSY
jgi:hypothetical protein